jgi:NADP-dependent 3-hydroxy acid dehydrogenase YdfG
LSGASLAGLSAVVTGASRGIGAAVAEALARRGVRLAIVSRRRQALEDLASRLGGALVVEADLAVRTSAERAADEMIEGLGGAPDILLNNAGIFAIASLETMEPGDFTAMVGTNLVGPFVLLRRLLPGMRERGRGHIVTIGSIADRTTFPGNAAYAATKFGARAMHQVLREETRGSGIRATLVSPAQTDTDIWEPIRFADGSAPDRRGMLPAQAVADAVIFAVTRPHDVNIDELRLSRS